MRSLRKGVLAYFLFFLYFHYSAIHYGACDGVWKATRFALAEQIHKIDDLAMFSGRVGFWIPIIVDTHTPNPLDMAIIEI